MSLAETQAKLAAAMQRFSPISDDVASIAAGNDRLSPAEQVEIYREQFWYRHRDVLKDDFEALEHYLGEEKFEELAKAYLTARPSSSWTLRDLGIEMIDYLAKTSADPFAVELAKVEWAFVDAFDGDDAPPFEPASIAGITEDEWPRAKIVLHPSLQRLVLKYPAHDYRIAARKGEECSVPEAREAHVVIYRGPSVLHCLEIEADAAAMLNELAAGHALEQACERAAAVAKTDLQAKLGGWFAEWTSMGWISAVVRP